MESIRWIYLAALPNSGSTIAAALANTHPDIVSPGELRGPGGRFHGPKGPTCSCGKTVAKCPFWCKVADQMQRKGLWWRPDYWGTMHHVGQEKAPLLTRFLFGRPGPYAVRDRVCEHLPLVGAKVRNLQQRNYRLGLSTLVVSGKTVLFDTSKTPEQIPRLARLSGVELSVVHFIRDPRGWCNSRKKKGFGPIHKTAAAWVKRNRYIARVCKAVAASKTIVIRYEDFCEDPKAALDRLCALADLPQMSIPASLNPADFHILGNRMRNLNKVLIQEDVSWRDELSSAEIATIEKKTASIAKHYGYTSSFGSVSS